MGDVTLSSAIPEVPLPLRGGMTTQHRSAAQSLMEGVSALQRFTFNGRASLPNTWPPALGGETDISLRNT